MHRLPTFTLVTIALSFAPLAANAESMRCGKWVVDEQATPAELLEKCGAPLEKTSETEDVLAINAAGAPYKVGETTREQWYYQRSPQALRMVVTIVDGVVKRIERVR